MAVRSEAGTGVIVSLVVFVLTTVFLLILTIVFYAGQTGADEERAKAQTSLAKYVRPNQRNTDFIKQVEAKAGQSNESVAVYLHKEYEQLMGFVAGFKGTSLDELTTKADRFGVREDRSVIDTLAQQHRDLRSRENEVERLNENLSSREATIADLNAKIATLKRDHQMEVDAVQEEIASYREAGIEYRQAVEEVKSDYIAAIDRHRDQYDSTVENLENKNESLNQELVVLRGRVDELESRLDQDRIKPKPPETLVDGRVIDVGTNDHVFIDRGKRQRIVLGMTFEIYDDPASIRVDPDTGQLPRGKASLQVIKVGDTTSTCKITRSTRGRPVVRDDVIVNAVYDPDYRFKFLVHGKFDIDSDGRPSEAEAEFLRSQIIKWGGTVVRGEQLSGDLDFLVLGAQPPLPPEPPIGASVHQINDWARKRKAHQKYLQLFRQAREAQIPVLNANRFFILIGYTDR